MAIQNMSVHVKGVVTPAGDNQAHVLGVPVAVHVDGDVDIGIVSVVEQFFGIGVVFGDGISVFLVGERAGVGIGVCPGRGASY